MHVRRRSKQRRAAALDALGVSDQCAPHDLALALYGTCAQQHLPVGLAYAVVV
jgi:hypothetical protein